MWSLKCLENFTIVWISISKFRNERKKFETRVIVNFKLIIICQLQSFRTKGKKIETRGRVSKYLFGKVERSAESDGEDNIPAVRPNFLTVFPFLEQKTSALQLASNNVAD